MTDVRRSRHILDGIEPMNGSRIKNDADLEIFKSLGIVLFLDEG
jgi:hypothetical protein